MYQKIRNLVFRTLIPAVLAVLMFPSAAFAQEPCVVNIPVKVSVSGGAPSGVQYKFKIEPITAGAPMPAAPEITIVNADTGSFGPISYTVPEDYQYRVTQTTEAQNRFTLDSSVYTLTVRVTNGEDTQAGMLVSEVWAVKDGQVGKSDLSFANSYSRPGGGGGGGGGGSNTGNRAVPSDGLTITDPQVPLAQPEQTIPDMEVPLIGLPKTGDTTMLGLWAALAAISGSGCVLLVMWKRRRDTDGCRA